MILIDSGVSQLDILTIQDKTVQLKPNLNHKRFSIYVAVCLRYDSNYVGQTKISLVTDGQPINLIGIDQNHNLIQEIYQINVHQDFPNVFTNGPIKKVMAPFNNITHKLP